MTNREFAQTNPLFQKACELAKLSPSTRQASKFRLKKGRAYSIRVLAERALITEEEERNSQLIA